MHGAEDGVDVEVQHAVPGVRVAFDDVAGDVGAGVGVEDVEPAGPLEDLRQHPLDALRVEEVDDDGVRLLAQLGAELGQPVLGAVDEHDRRAGGERAAGAGEADAGGGAGDRDHLAFQGFVHGGLLGVFEGFCRAASRPARFPARRALPSREAGSGVPPLAAVAATRCAQVRAVFLCGFSGCGAERLLSRFLAGRKRRKGHGVIP